MRLTAQQLALSAATPFFRGLVSDLDCRWVRQRRLALAAGFAGDVIASVGRA
jgi:hypothetical protein